MVAFVRALVSCDLVFRLIHAERPDHVITGRKSGADMARLYNISQPTVSRIVAEHRMAQP
jgi:hypothetical protein